jgi:hypothetical protein
MGHPSLDGCLITKAKLQRYKDFDGDLDDWVRSQKSGMDDTLTGEDWIQIDKVVQRLKIQKNGSASVDYRNETERLLKKVLVSDELIQLARSMAK